MKKRIWLSLLACICIPALVSATSSELDTAVTWLYQNGLTQYTTSTAFSANRTIRRDEASKFFSQFATNILKNTSRITKPACGKFSDLTMQNTMRGFVVDSCVLWFMKWSNGKFNPSWSLSNAQAIAVTIRILEWEKDESWTHWADAYYQRADELWLLDGLPLDSKNTPITRGNLGILLYRLGQLPTMNGTAIAVANTMKPDFVITSVVLDPAYPSPKVWDEAPYLKVTVKNIWASVVLSWDTKVIVTCGSSIRKEITNWTFGANQDTTIAWLTNTPWTYPNMFPEAKNYNISCNVSLQSSSIYERNENNNSNSFSVTVGATSSLQPDLVINSVLLDPNYPNPKVWDSHVYVRLNMENLGGLITFSSRTKGIFSCSNNNVEILHKEITSWKLQTNDMLVLEGITNVYNSAIDLFPNVDQNYALNCSLLLSSTEGITESQVNNSNYKNITFPVTASLADLAIDSIKIKDPNSSLLQTFTTVGLTNNYLILTIKNIGNTVYDSSSLASDNYNYLECYSDVAGEWGATDHIDIWQLQPGQSEELTFPSNLFSTFLTQTTQQKLIHCDINYWIGTKDLNWNEMESNYTNNDKTFPFAVEGQV